MEEYISNLEKRKVNVTMAVSPRVRLELEKLAKESGNTLSEFLRDHVVTFCLDGKQLQEHKDKIISLKDELDKAYQENEVLNERIADLELELEEAQALTGNDIPEGERVARVFEERDKLSEEVKSLKEEINQLNELIAEMDNENGNLNEYLDEKFADYQEANKLYENTKTKLNQVCDEVTIESFNRLKQLMNRMCEREYWAEKGLKKKLIQAYLQAFYANDYNFGKEKNLQIIEEVFENHKPTVVKEAEKRLAEMASKPIAIETEIKEPQYNGNDKLED